MERKILPKIKITPQIRKEIIKIIDKRIKEAHITREDFSELKEIVKNLGIRVNELAQAQKRTEERVEELAQAQKRTEERVEELAQAQKQTEIELQKLTEEVRGLTRGLKLTREDLGGLSRSFGYAFENEAYRMLPSILKNNYAIEMTEKMIRKEIGGKEINIFGKAKLNSKNVLIIGEVKVRLEKKRDEKKDVFEELEEKIEAVKKEYKGDVIRILVTHYAEPEIIKKAKEKDIILVQSFEW